MTWSKTTALLVAGVLSAHAEKAEKEDGPMDREDKGKGKGKDMMKDLHDSKDVCQFAADDEACAAMPGCVVKTMKEYMMHRKKMMGGDMDEDESMSEDEEESMSEDEDVSGPDDKASDEASDEDDNDGRRRRLKAGEEKEFGGEDKEFGEDKDIDDEMEEMPNICVHECYFVDLDMCGGDKCQVYKASMEDMMEGGGKGGKGSKKDDGDDEEEHGKPGTDDGKKGKESGDDEDEDGPPGKDDDDEKKGPGGKDDDEENGPPGKDGDDDDEDGPPGKDGDDEGPDDGEDGGKKGGKGGKKRDNGRRLLARMKDETEDKDWGNWVKDETDKTEWEDKDWAEDKDWGKDETEKKDKDGEKPEDDDEKTGGKHGKGGKGGEDEEKGGPGDKSSDDGGDEEEWGKGGKGGEDWGKGDNEDWGGKDDWMKEMEKEFEYCGPIIEKPQTGLEVVMTFYTDADCTEMLELPDFDDWAKDSGDYESGEESNETDSEESGDGDDRRRLQGGKGKRKNRDTEDDDDDEGPEDKASEDKPGKPDREDKPEDDDMQSGDDDDEGPGGKDSKDGPGGKDKDGEGKDGPGGKDGEYDASDDASEEDGERREGGKDAKGEHGKKGMDRMMMRSNPSTHVMPVVDDQGQGKCSFDAMADRSHGRFRKTTCMDTNILSVSVFDDVLCTKESDHKPDLGLIFRNHCTPLGKNDQRRRLMKGGKSKKTDETTDDDENKPGKPDEEGENGKPGKGEEGEEGGKNGGKRKPCEKGNDSFTDELADFECDDGGKKGGKDGDMPEQLYVKVDWQYLVKDGEEVEEWCYEFNSELDIDLPDPVTDDDDTDVSSDDTDVSSDTGSDEKESGSDDDDDETPGEDKVVISSVGEFTEHCAAMGDFGLCAADLLCAEKGGNCEPEKSILRKNNKVKCNKLKTPELCGMFSGCELNDKDKCTGEAELED